MTREHPDLFEYDVAISFAVEDRAVAEELTKLFTNRDISVFRDEYTSEALWGSDVIDHLVNLYSRKARYCVLLISHYYPLRQWTEADRSAAQERAFRDADEYILPIRLDDTEIPGLEESAGYRDLRQQSLETIVSLLEQQLATTREQSGPPPESHDLRSGNVPPAHPKLDRQ